MISDTETKKRMQLLRMTKIILEEERAAQFNKDYAAWVAANATSTTQIPPQPVPVTEEEIVARAVEFFKTENENSKTVDATASSTMDAVRKIFTEPPALDVIELAPYLLTAKQSIHAADSEEQK